MHGLSGRIFSFSLPPRNGRHFPSFGAGDQGRVLQVDKEALNCDVLFDGNSRPIPVALRHLRLLKAGASNGSRAQLPVSRVLDFKDSDPKPEGRARASEARGSSASPRRSVSISVAEPVSADARREARPETRPPSFLHSMDQRLQACEAAFDGPTPNYRVVKPGQEDVVRSSDLNLLEDRIQRLEQRLKDEVEVLTKRLQQATAFGQSWESRANALERHIKSLGHVPPSPAPSSCSGLSARGSAPLYLSAAIPQQRLSATPPAKGTSTMPPTPSTGPCVTQAEAPETCSACGATVLPGSRFCIKCGAGGASGASVPREREDPGSTRRALSAGPGSAQAPSCVRGTAYLATRPQDFTPPRSRHLVSGTVLQQPVLPPALPHDGDMCGCSPGGYVAGPCFASPAGHILTPRLLLPQRPFG